MHDPAASAPEALSEYGIQLAALDELHPLDALVLAVSHKPYLALWLAGARTQRAVRE